MDAFLAGLGSCKPTPARKALFGSITQSVILDGDVPVAVTGPGEA